MTDSTTRSSLHAASSRGTWRGRSRAVLIGAVCGVAAIALSGPTHAEIGPFDASLSPRPSLTGATTLHLGPLGSIELDTHDAPVDLVVRIDQLRVSEAEQIARDPSVLESLENELVADSRRALVVLAARSLAFAVVGGAVGAFAASLRWRRAVLAAGAALALPISITGVAASTFDASAVSEPHYRGLLAIAPNAVGDVESIVRRFDDYRAQLVDLVTNVATLYQAAQQLPALAVSDSAIRLLHVSDIHLNPQAFDLMRQLTSQFGVDAIVDTGDTTDWGTEPELQLVDRIASLRIPYVWVRGNHDSPATQSAVARQPNATVLDGGAVEVAGLRIWGIGDPRYTPDKSDDADTDSQETAAADFAPRVAELLRATSPAPDVALVHDARIAADVGDTVPLVLAGHTHKPRKSRLGDTTLLVQGSTGGAGLRGLQGEDPLPLTCSVLYFDAASRELIAYDEISVDGLGEAGARIKRHLVERHDDPPDPAARRG